MWFFKKKKAKESKQHYNYKPEVETITVKVAAKDLNSPKKPAKEIIDEDSGLPFGWITHHKGFVDKVQNEEQHFISLYTSANGVLNRYAGLKSYIQYLKDGLKHYRQVGTNEGKYFKYYVVESEAAKSFKKDFEYMSRNIDSLLEEERNQKKQQELVNSALPTIENDLVQIIKDNPGIFQKNIYKEFDPLLKELVSSTLYFMAKDNKIIREKSGNSYKLYVKTVE